MKNRFIKECFQFPKQSTLLIKLSLNNYLVHLIKFNTPQKVDNKLKFMKKTNNIFSSKSKSKNKLSRNFCNNNKN